MILTDCRLCRGLLWLWGGWPHRPQVVPCPCRSGKPRWWVVPTSRPAPPRLPPRRRGG